MRNSPGALRRLIVLAVIFLFGCSLAFAQAQTGEILGVITDITGASVPGASVTVTNTDTGVARTIKSDDQGRYDAADLQIGNYQVQTQMQGFAPQAQKGLVLSVGQKLLADFKLEVGTVSQEVTVSSTAAPQVNTTTSEVGALVNQSQMQDLPLNGRNYQQLFGLVPGVQPVQAQTTNGPNFGSNVKFSVAGSRVTGENVMLDGVTIRGFWGQGAGIQVLGTSLGIDGIAEFQTMTSTFNAQYSGLSVMNEVTRSGTNNLHGSAYGFFRNSAINTRNYFDPASGPPPAHWYQFGGAIGGPIKKNKTFFFGNYEGLRADLTLYNSEEAPDANALNGQLPCLEAPDIAPCNVAGTPPGTLVTVPPPGNPASAAAVQGLLNIYKALGVAKNPGATEVLSSSGVPTGSVQLTLPGLQPQHENFYAVKVDHQISAKNNIAVRYVMDDGGLTNPWPDGGTGTLPGFLQVFPNTEVDPERNQYVTVQDRHVFSDTLINVASSSFVRTRQKDADTYTEPPNAATNYVQELTFISDANFGSHIPGPARPPGIVNVSGAASIKGSSRYDIVNWTQNMWTEQDEIDWVHGAHAFKIGGEFARIQCNCQQNPDPGGAYTFGAVAVVGPFSGLEGLLEDRPSSFIAPPPGLDGAERNGRQSNISAYFQDDWKVTRKLTLNLGIRDDFVTIPTEAHDVIYRITSTTPGPFNGYDHVPRYYLNNPSTRNIDPRVGLAWDVFGDHKTSVRSGFGIFHSVIYPRDYMQGMTFDYPIIQANQGCPQACPSYPNPFTNGFGISTLGQSRSENPWTYCCTSYQMEYNFTIERQLPKAVTLSLGYVGSGGVHLIAAQESNVATPSAIGGPEPGKHPGNQYRNPAGPFVNCSPTVTTDCFPYAAFTGIDNETPEANSHYNSMVLTATRNVATLTLQSSFTWSKCIDWISNGIDGVDVGNDAALWIQPYLPSSFNKGPCAFNVGKNWTTNALIPLPFHGNMLKAGWQIGLIASARTGSPVTPTENVDQGELAGGQSGTYLSFGSDRPDIVGGAPLYQKFVKVANGAAQGVQWYNPNYFHLQTAGYIGDARRGMIIGPGFFNMDASLTKTVNLRKLGESAGVQLRGDVFNVFDHTNLQLPSGGMTFSPKTGSATSPTFISGTVGTSRQLQVSAKLVF